MSNEPESSRVLVEVTIAAPVDTVWRAVREPDQLLNWFGWDADTLAEEVEVIFGRPAAVDEQAHTIRFQAWEGISDGFELAPRQGATVLRVVRFGATADIDWKSTYEDVNEGWVNFVQQLRLLLERHPGARRRTIYRSGAARPGVPAPSEALGLASLRERPDGADYEAVLPTGDEIGGVIWHRTHFQLGMLVRAWGDGLLVVDDKDATPSRPHGGGAVLLTTFGLDDATFAALERRFAQWWEERYPSAHASAT